MNEMIEFSLAMMNGVADFLAAEPIFYLFGMVCFCFIVKIFMQLFSIR